MKKIKIFVAISSNMVDKENREAIRASWLQDIPDGIECRFFTEDGSSIDKIDDTVILNIPDDNKKDAARFLLMATYALKHHDFDWFFHCDDSTYLDLSRLANITNDKYDLIGDGFLRQRNSPDCSVGYMLSRSTLEIISAENIWLRGKNSDFILGRVLHEFSAKKETTHLLSRSHESYPTHDNNIISTKCSHVEDMKTIHSLRWEQPITHSKARLEEWSDDLFFYTNGLFRRKGTNCYGWWKIRWDGCLFLKWKKWDSIDLMEKEGTYYSNQMILEPIEGYPSLLDIATETNNNRLEPLIVEMNPSLYTEDLDENFYNHIVPLKSEIKKLNTRNEHLRVLEWGSGLSTILLCAELKKDSYILSIEHNNEYQINIPELEIKRLKQVFLTAQKPFGKSEAYTTYPIYDVLESGELFDLILIDGRNRTDCLAIAAMLLAPDGVVILGDAERENYQKAFPLYGKVEFISGKSQQMKTALLRKPVCSLIRKNEIRSK